ncbi:MAG TPA: flagellar basal body P-ring protein FlgI [Candidatus Binatia bacterium]|nr:flagellar basal body P-ring protein FlgI [Candidatus Binatia bacterium]
MAVLSRCARQRASVVALASLVGTSIVALPARRPALASRIKDIAFVEGIRPNQLTGYGVVVGLQGTGDGQQALFTIQSILNMLRRQGVLITVDPRQIRVKNAAAVLVTASLPPFARSGDRIDVQVSSLGDAKSLRGGTLISTPLAGGDQQVYAVAQGPVSLGGGFSTSAPGASVSSGQVTAGVIPSGAIVERAVPADFAADGRLRLSLHRPDITTATRVASAIAASTRAPAEAVNPKTIEVQLEGGGALEAMQLLTRIETIDVVADTAARIIVNERTGTVIIGQDVRVKPVAVAHGSLQVEVKTDYGVSQPAPFSGGQTVIVPDSQIVTQEGQKSSLAIISRGGVSLGQLVGNLNALGVTPQDLIAVLEAIQSAGALEAELEMM